MPICWRRDLLDGMKSLMTLWEWGEFFLPPVSGRGERRQDSRSAVALREKIQ
jgi:hypothetical protein